MLVEFSIIPVGAGIHLSGPIAEVLRLVDASGLRYQLTPAGTCVEGGWDEVMSLLKQCHEHVRQTAVRVVWMIKIDDEEAAHDMLRRHVAVVEEKVGRPLNRLGS
jgi:uncharacterized protein (TIGR00106 family)